MSEQKVSYQIDFSGQSDPYWREFQAAKKEFGQQVSTRAQAQQYEFELKRLKANCDKMALALAETRIELCQARQQAALWKRAAKGWRQAAKDFCEGWLRNSGAAR